MQDIFFIQLDADAGRARWSSAAGELADGTLAEAAAQVGGRRVLVFVPAADVSFRDVAVPTRNRARIAAAVPYLLEEQLAADVDELHFAVGERAADGRVAVAIVARARMDAWLAALHAAGIQPAALVPECLALPYRPLAWTLWWGGDAAVVRSAAQRGFALDPDNVPFVLTRALAEAAPAAPDLLWVLDGGGAAGEAERRLADLGVPVQAERETRPLLALLTEHYNEQQAIDLLQGAYSRREQLGRLWRPWRPAAALLAVWVLAQFGIKAYEYQRLDREHARLQQEIADIYLQTFPGSKRVVNARVQMEQQLSALRGGGGDGDFMQMMAALSRPVAAAADVELERVAYKQGELNVALVIGDLQRLEQLKAQLAASGLAVEIQSATARNDRVEAQLHLRRGAS